jgi:hypothetical protein
MDPHNEVQETGDLILNSWKYVSGLQYVISMIQNHPCYDPSVGVRGIMQQPLYDDQGNADHGVMRFSKIDAASTAAFLDDYLAIRGVLSQLGTLFSTERKRESVRSSLRIPYEMLRTGKDEIPDLARIPGFLRSLSGFCELEEEEARFIRLLEGVIRGENLPVLFRTLYDDAEIPDRALGILLSLKERMTRSWLPELEKFLDSQSIPTDFMPRAYVILLMKWNMDEVQNLGGIRLSEGKVLCPAGKVFATSASIW